MEISDEIGKYLVTMAKRAIMERVANRCVLAAPPNVPDQAMTNTDVFASTRNHHDSRGIHGCVCLPSPERPSIDSILESAISAAIRDPRFLLIESRELETTRIGVCAPTMSGLIGMEDRLCTPDTIRVGRDSVIVRCSSGSGLPLPHLAPGQGFDSNESM